MRGCLVRILCQVLSPDVTTPARCSIDLDGHWHSQYVHHPSCGT